MGKNDSYAAITAFIIENRVPAYRLAFSYVRNKEDALDIIQDSICKAFVSAHSLKNHEHVKSWFYRILVNTAIDFIRKNKKYIFLESDALEAEVSGSEDSYPDFDLRQSIDKLSVTNKTIIVLRFYEGLELKEIAEIMDENLSTIKTRLYSSLKRLRIELDQPRGADTRGTDSRIRDASNKEAQVYEIETV